MWSRSKASRQDLSTTLGYRSQLLWVLCVVSRAQHFFLFCLIPMTVIGHGFKFMILIWLFSFLLFQHSCLREIICLVVSSWEHVFKAFERIQCTHGNDYDCNKHNNSQCLECTQCRRCREADPILDGEKLLEEEMATHSSILTWEIPWTEEPSRLQSMESQRIRHN